MQHSKSATLTPTYCQRLVRFLRKVLKHCGNLQTAPPPKHIAIPSVRGRSGSGWTMVKEVSDDSQVSGRGKSASHSVQPIKMQRTQLWTGSNSTVVANCTKVGKEQSLECNDYFRMTTGIRDIQKAIGMYTILTGQQIALGLLPLSSLLHHDTSLFYPHQCG